MNLLKILLPVLLIGIPRVSGDEPITADYDGDHSLYSPRERG